MPTANLDQAHTFVSYAQNGEDVVLARGFTESDGFFVDIGAYDPDEESVTKVFSLRGWRGINVDPIASFIDRFEVERPRDINICAAIGPIDGEQEIWVSPTSVPGHSTTDPAIAAAHARDGLAFAPQRVRSMRLDTLLDHYLPPGQAIDFLKIDVEGAEADVLSSWDPQRHRPRVVLVETVAPYDDEDPPGDTSDHVAEADWRNGMLLAGYTRTLFDGLNEFWVRADEPHLIASLSTPANVLDRYVTAGYHTLRTYADSLESDLVALRKWATSLRDRVVWLESMLSSQHRRDSGDPGTHNPAT